MAGLKKRKFSFDIPRLKIGPSKSDTKVLRDHLLSSQIDSPPPTPKSVRPPLSPYAEAELRAACAYVLQNFKPSHIAYEEQYGGGSNNFQAKPQLDYAAIKSGPPRPLAASPPALTRITSHDQNESAIDADEDDESVSSERFRYKPQVATEDLFKQEQDPQERAHSRAALRADQLMAPQRSKTISGSKKEGHGRHTRSASNPIRGQVVAAPKQLLVERPKAMERAASTGTTGSTPETDNTDYPWSEKASTAMTSAALTPARSSKRTSSQAVASGSESSSLPKAEPGNGDWMRQELEKHKRAHEARKQQGQELALEDAASSTVVSDTTPTQVPTEATTPVKVKIPARKPVPTSRSSSRQEAHPPRTDSSQSMEQPQPMERPTSDLPVAADVRQEVSRQADAISRAETRQPSRQDNGHGRKRSMSRVREYFRPGAAAGSTKQEGSSRGLSRSASITRQVKNYVSSRAASRAASRKPSVDLGARSESRGRSIDSFRSAMSHGAPSVTSTTDKFKAFKTFHRSKKSDSTPEPSRPGSSSSTKDGRGRAATREEGSPQQPKSRPPVNLNRDLPPLPSLDQWRSSTHSATPPISGSRLASPATEKPDPIKSPLSATSQTINRPEKITPPSRPAPVPSTQAEILAARMGSPTTTRTRSATSSVDMRTVPPPPTAPPPAPPAPTERPTLSATISSIDDLDYDQLAPTKSIEAVMGPEAKKDRRRSKSIQMPPHYRPEKPQQSTSNPSVPTIKTPLTGKAAVIKTSRTDPVATHNGNNKNNLTAGGPPNFNLFRSPSRATVMRKATAATTINTPNIGHSRTNSGHHDALRKYSIDDYASNTTARMIDPLRYQNMVEISASPGPQQTQVPTRELKPSKSKWWQRKGGAGAQGWMDQVLKSGSSGGVIVSDEVAGSPVVRY